MIPAIAGLLVSCSDPGDDVSVPVETADETPHFLVPYDSIGVETGDSTMMLGNIWGSSITPDGRVAILDNAVGGIRFYTGEGEYLSSFIPTGEGPGEFFSIDRMVFDNLGNMCLASMDDRKVCIYDTDLNLVREILFTSAERTGPSRVQFAPGTAVVISNMTLLGEDSLASDVGLYTTDSEPDIIYRRLIVSIAEGGNTRDLTRMDFAVGENGRVYISSYDFDRYEIMCFSPEGEILFTFGREEYEPEAKSDSLLQATTEKARQQYIQYNGSDDGFNYRPDPFWHPITSLQIDGQNRIWVRGERYTDRLDIFDENGSFLYTVQGILPEWQEYDAWNIRIDGRGILADMRNPEMFPVVYLLREETE